MNSFRSSQPAWRSVFVCHMFHLIENTRAIKGTLVESTSQCLLTYNLKHLILSSFVVVVLHVFFRKYFNVKIENNSNFWYECDLKLYWSCLNVAVVVAFLCCTREGNKSEKKILPYRRATNWNYLALHASI